MARTRKIKVPQGLRCNECGSTDLIGAGKDWKHNPDGDNPPRVRVQKLRCKSCGKIMIDGAVESE